MKREKKGLTVQEQYLVTQMDWWNANYTIYAEYGDKPKKRSASTLREMINRRHQDWDWEAIKLLAIRLREPITSSNITMLIGNITGNGGRKGERTYMQKWADKKSTMLKLALAEQEIEGKSTEEISRMLLLETL